MNLVVGASRLGRRLGQYEFSRLYHTWTTLHAVIVTVLAMSAEIDAIRQFSLAALAVWGPLALLVLYLGGQRFHPDGAGSTLANLLTASRVAAGGILLATVALSVAVPAIAEFMRSPWGIGIVGLLLLVELTDFLDGQIARRANAGGFGSVWDMECDSIFAVALALALREIHGAGLHVLLIGLLRYLYVIFFRYDADPPAVPRIYKHFAKTTAAVVVTSLIVGLLPVLTPLVRTIGFAVVALMQLTSFAWDLVLQRRAGHVTA